MRRNIYFFIMAALTFIMAGCDNNETKPKAKAVSLTVRVSEISYNTARLTVKHNGPEDITWYGFLTKETGKNEFDLFIEKYNEILTNGDFSVLKREQERNILLDNLEENTAYKYIAFGLKENGELYDNVGLGYMEFTTSQNIYIMTKTNDWELKHLGRNEDGTRELIEVVAKKGGRFGWNYISKESIEAWNKENPNGYELWENDIYMATVNAFEMFALQQISTVQYYMSMGYALEDLTYTYIAGSPFDIERLPSGDYYLVAYGFEGNGSHTQTYSVQELSLKEEDATDEYLKWLGSYRFTGEADVTDKDGEVQRKEINYNITIEKYDNNYMYRVKGWECGEDVKYDWEEDIMQLDKEAGEFLAFPAYYQKGKFIVKENPMTYITFDGQTELTLGIYGYAFSKNDDQEIPVIWDESIMNEPAAPMAIAEPIAEGETSTVLVGQEATVKAWNTTFTYSKMGYLAWDPLTGAYQTINPAMRFPITMTKLAESSDQGTLVNPSMASKGAVTFSTNVISDDFLKKDFSRLEKVKPQVFDRYLEK